MTPLSYRRLRSSCRLRYPIPLEVSPENAGFHPVYAGGQRQRVAIARALVNKPDVILADEPTGNLDERTGEEIYELLGRINQDLRTSFLVATHNDRLARQMGRVVRISEGRLET